MASLYNTIVQLTSQPISDEVKARALNDFAYQLGWRPSDKIDDPHVSDFTNAHLMVEYGLENSAVISFIREPYSFSGLTHSKRRNLFSLSYNNLVDWHIGIERNRVTYIYNRSDPPQVVTEERIDREDVAKLRSESFDKVIGRKPNPNIPALDDSLIKTISYWRRNISAELASDIPTKAFSTLFNLIIFIRAAEDQKQKLTNDGPRRGLVDAWNRFDEDNRAIETVLNHCLTEYIGDNIPEYISQSGNISIFDTVDQGLIYSLLSDFYINKYAKYYRYDFSVMSKHALSKIYEKYVSVLRQQENSQKTLFPPLPIEDSDKSMGSVYTPQYIARFFARYIEEQMPPLRFRKLNVVDPACGSGIFLRTMLERQCDPLQSTITTSDIQRAFDNTYGLDRDSNAAQATRLSLALLYLVLTNELPDHLNILSEEALHYLQNNDQYENSFDVVVTNPPFVSTTSLDDDMKKSIDSISGDLLSGRVDLYMGFLIAAIKILKPGGYGMFVLPHSFLIKDSAKEIRAAIARECSVEFVADLSDIDVFPDYGIYVILLIFRKESEDDQSASATIVECDKLAGAALQDAVEGRDQQNPYYTIYQLDQSFFGGDGRWILLPPTEASIEKKFNRMKDLDDFLRIREGFVSGADDVFIVDRDTYDTLDKEIFIPFLPDKEMKLYSTPTQTDKFFFYPYKNDQKLNEEVIKKQFADTWEYLLDHKEKLNDRNQVLKENIKWWCPERPRPPRNMMIPKIISPHLVLMPRFSLDLDGRYGISRSPLMHTRDHNAGSDILKFFLGVLNSSVCFWYISKHSHVYKGGYTMLEPKTLRDTPVPDPFETRKHSTDLFVRLIRLVTRRLNSDPNEEIILEEKIDGIVADLYNLSSTEREKIGLEQL